MGHALCLLYHPTITVDLPEGVVHAVIIGSFVDNNL
jgi:hypothetical protein